MRSAAAWRLAGLLEPHSSSDPEFSTRRENALRRACTGGIGQACHRLAEVLDAAEAAAERVASFYGQACDRDRPLRCLRYAERLASGTDVTSDPDFARRILDKLCEKELAEAYLQLVGLYRDGRGLPTSPPMAEALKRRRAVSASCRRARAP